MSLPMTPLFWTASVIPVVFLLVVIIKFGWGVAKAAPLGMILAGALAMFVYRSSITALCMEAGKGIWNAATILLVVWPAVFSYELSCEAGGFEAIRSGIQSLTRHELFQILILGWIFPSFLQGITGFGVAVAVGAPLLVSIGVSPFYSIVIVLLCHSQGATFGTLALAWEALVAEAGVDGGQKAQAAVLAAAMIWIFNILAVLLSCWFYGKKKSIREIGPVVCILSLILGGGQMILAPINATISNFLPSAMALGAAFIISKSKRYGKAWRIEDSLVMERKGQEERKEGGMTFHQAFLPYYSLTVITVACLLIPPVNSFLSQWSLAFSFPETVTGYGYVTEAVPFFSPLKPLTYAGTFLALSSTVSYEYYKTKGYILSDGFLSVWKRTSKKCLAPTAAITCFIIMSKFMGSSGQIYIMSQGVVMVLGSFYVMAAPLFGILGTFITSSNMSSNILLGNFQRTAADFLNVNPAITLALQTVGGVLGTAFSPGCIIMGVSTTGYDGGEGRILKKIIPCTAICAVAFGFIFYVFSCFA